MHSPTKSAQDISQNGSGSPITKARRARGPRKTPTKNKLSVQNIKRIDSPKTHGWQVHVRRGGILKTKLFSDRKWGGKENALEQAIILRDRLLDDMAKLSKPLWKIERTPRSNTGHLGVSYTETHNGSGEPRGAITVTVRKALGKPVNRKFSVKKLGYDEALKRAVAWRQEILDERDREESLA